MDKPVLLVIFAGNCGACKEVKKTWYTVNGVQGVKDKILASGLVEVAEYQLPSMEAPTPSDYPKDIQRFRAWYPMVALVTRQSWNEAKNGGKIKSVVYYGIDDGNTVRQDLSVKYEPITERSLMNWIKRSLNNEIFANNRRTERNDDNKPMTSSNSNNSQHYMIFPNTPPGSFCSNKSKVKKK